MHINFQIDANPKTFLREIRVVNNSINSQVSHRQLGISSVCIASDAQLDDSFQLPIYTMVYYNRHSLYNALQSGAKVSEIANAVT